MKKLLISFLLGLTLFFAFAPNFLVAKAADTSTWYNQSFQEWSSKVNDTHNSSEIFGERYTAAQVQWVIYGIVNFIINLTGNTQVLSCVTQNQTDLSACTDAVKSLFAYSGTGANIAQGSQNKSLLSLVFASDRPISAISYVKGIMLKFSPVPTAHAQTTGFGFTTALSPFQNMWRAFRNIAFGLFVIVAIVFAFMIMFRVKLSPQTVISVQSALPKIIIALILVTFSFAIAGFLIDLMYVVIGIISMILTSTSGLIPTNWLIQNHTYTAADLFSLLTIGNFGGVGGASGILNLLSGLFLPILMIFVILLAGGAIVTGLSAGIGAIIEIIALIALIIIVIVMIWVSIKTIWALFKAFVKIILLTIFAPIQLVLGPLIPSLSFGAWVKNYLSALSVFVVTGVLWLFAWIFSIDAFNLIIPSSSGIITPAATTDAWPPLLGSSGFGNVLLFAGVSFVLFTMMPKATELVQSFLSGKPFAYGSAVGEAFGPIRSAWGQTGAPLVAAVQKGYSEGRTKELVEKLISATTRGPSKPIKPTDEKSNL